jgi:hypothetical protein
LVLDARHRAIVRSSCSAPFSILTPARPCLPGVCPHLRAEFSKRQRLRTRAAPRGDSKTRRHGCGKARRGGRREEGLCGEVVGAACSITGGIP